MMDFFLSSRMEEAGRDGLKRKLNVSYGKDFMSNDYLGLTTDWDFHKILKDAVSRFDGAFSGSGGSRLLGGHKRFCEEVESRLAAFCQTESALFFPSGYQANVALLSCLSRKGDVVLSDEHNHASIIDGVRLSKGDKIIYKHNDVEELESRLQDCRIRYDNIFIVCESLYSMEGEHAPLQKISELAVKYGAKLIVDESHATGLFGYDGSGLVNELGLRDRIFCTVHTAGKALGTAGAWIACRDSLTQYMVNFSRGFIYSTAPSPMQFLFVDESIRYLNDIPHRREVVLADSRRAREKLKKAFVGEKDVAVLGDNSPILPIVLGDNQKVMTVASQLRKRGFAVAAIRYPTVPKGSARLRLSMGHDNSGRVHEELLECLVPLVKEVL